MKVFISTAIWGKNYIDIFAKYSLSSLFAPGNIPAASDKHEITLHITTTKKDLKLLQGYKIYDVLLNSKINFDIDFIDEITNEKKIPVGVGAKKYKFLTGLQNHAIEKSKTHDLIIFNYSDFVWGNSSIDNIIEKCNNGLDSVLGFCLPVDLNGCSSRLTENTDGSGILIISNQENSEISVQGMHKEAMLRYWDSPIFTTTPTYLLWKVGGEGIVLRAYHQTVLALRTQIFNDGFEKNEGSSLDGYYSSLIVNQGNFEVATDSSKVSVFSIYDTIIDSRLIKWRTKRDSMTECLRSTVTPQHRVLALEYPILIKTTTQHTQSLWDEVTIQSSDQLAQLHREVAFDQKAHDELYLQDDLQEGINNSELFIRIINLSRRIALKVGIPKLLYEKIVLIKKWFLNGDGISKKRLVIALLDYLQKNKLLGLHSELLLAKLFPNIHQAIYVSFAYQSSIDIFASNYIAGNINKLGWVNETTSIKKLIYDFRERMSIIYPEIESIGFKYYKILGEFNHIVGYIDDSRDCFFKSEKIRIKLLNNVSIVPNLNVIFPRDTLSSIGMIGHFESFVDYKNRFKPELIYSIIGDEVPVANDVFLSFFEKEINICTRADIKNALAKNSYLYINDRLLELMTVNWHWYSPNIKGENEEQVFLHRFIYDINQFNAVNTQKLSSIEEFNKSHIDELSELLHKLGVSYGEEYVCLHIRTEKYRDRVIGKHLDSFRNPSIENYAELINKISEKYKVILMGDPIDLQDMLSFKHLLDSTRLINYSNSNFKSSLNDIILISNCFYFVASPSGLYTVASFFDKNIVLIDYPAYDGLPWKKNQLMIPLHYFDKSRLGYLKQYDNDFINRLTHGHALTRNNIETHFNTSTEILDGFSLFSDTVHIQKYPYKNHLAVIEHRKISNQLNARLKTRRDIDVLVPTKDRPSKLFELLQSGLSLGIPEINFIIFDDGSMMNEMIPGVGIMSTFEVCNFFNSNQICYFYSSESKGVAWHWESYFNSQDVAEFIMAIPDKDKFISAESLKDAIKILNNNAEVALVIAPLSQIDRACNDRVIDFTCEEILSDDKFYEAYVKDNSLKHCSMWGIFRSKSIIEKKLPHSLNLKKNGLDDGFGIDLDLVINATLGNKIGFIKRPIVRRSTLGGGTEKYPLTFAYTYYQYSQRIFSSLLNDNKITIESFKEYLLWWHILILRGANVALKPVHGSEIEVGVERIRGHLKTLLHLYLIFHLIKYRIIPNKEYILLFIKTSKGYLWNFIQKSSKITVFGLANRFSAKYIFNITNQ